MNKFNLNNRTAIITGGAQGFGLAMTKRFLESGASVIIWDLDKAAAGEIDLPMVPGLDPWVPPVSPKASKMSGNLMKLIHNVRDWKTTVHRY